MPMVNQILHINLFLVQQLISSHDPRNVVDILEKYGDAHVSDSGWREVDIEEWFSDE